MKWYEIKAEAGSRVADILIYDVIVDYAWDEDEVSAKGFIDDLNALGTLDEIRVRINSPGGSVYAGNVIYNVLKRQSAKVTIIIDGIAASIASVIAMAGDKVIMPDNAMMMIHDPWTYASGNADDLRKTINMLETARASMIGSYTGKTGLDEEKISALMKAETWMTAAMAKELGFADEVGQPVAMAASFDLSRYSNVPKALMDKQQPAAQAKATGPVAQQSLGKGDDTMDLKALQEKHPDLYAQLLKMGEDAGYEKGVKAGITAEQERIQAVNAALIPGHEALIAKLAADGKTSGAEAALAVNQAERALRATALSDMQTDKPKAPQAAEPGDEGGEAKQIKEDVSGLVAAMNRA